ncbi:structural cement protein Gp24 [Achromobacter pulmonis]|uniref:structural cement protein Gp24 n=1 Tax=Achromobacter pulmonis TaxID=1389932 RepID=UPI0020C61257|nr:hypothetical protein [Achromobacter pulmonis]
MMPPVYDDRMDVAYAGMKADLGYDDVETCAAAGSIAPGVIVGDTTNDRIVAGPGSRIRGLALHTHTIPRDGGYREFDAVSVLRVRRGWAKVANGGTVTKDGPVKCGADGAVSDGGATPVPNAVFRSSAVDTAGGKIALIELHAPFATASAAP